MNRKMFKGITLLVLLLSFVYFPIAQATVENNSSISEIKMQIFNIFTINIESNSSASIVHADSGLNLNSALLSDHTKSLDEPPLQYVKELPTVPIETYQMDSLTMSDPINICTSVFNVTIFNFVYSYKGASGRVTALKFEINKEDHRMIAISVISECTEPVLSFLHYESATNMLEGFGDLVRINGSHTLAEGYMHLSNVMRYASQSIYAGSDNIYFNALETAYLKMAEYSDLIAYELQSNPTLSCFNKAARASLTLLMDPTFTGSGNWCMRWLIKLAIYSTLIYLVYNVWAVFANPPAALITIGALVAILSAFVSDVLGIAVDIITYYLHLWAPYWGWFWWVPETVAWIVENIGLALFPYVVLKYKPIIYGNQYAVAIFTIGAWVFVDYLVEWTLDEANLFRDY
ncbi:MAG: hypothetical protein QXU81_09635 [Candidatus Bathyarchaeia archaeon]